MYCTVKLLIPQLNTHNLTPVSSSVVLNYCNTVPDPWGHAFINNAIMGNL